MVDRRWNSSLARAEAARLIAPGVLGFYTQIEATEVFATPDGQSSAVNVFSILVAEDRLGAATQAPRYLNPSRIKLRTLRGWTFGVTRYTFPITDLAEVLERLCEAGEWRSSGKPLQVGKLAPVPRQFVPPDSLSEVPWNRVLKNNFWNGSHLLEWSDSQKVALQPLFDDPRRLQELSDAVRKCVPIGLAGLSDRLGNIVVQLPVTALIAKFKRLPGSGYFAVELAWHRKATPRPLRATCAVEFDSAISGYVSCTVQAPETPLPMLPGQGLHRGIIWDDQHQIVLAATAPSSFINTMVLNVQVSDPEPRIFTTEKGTSQHRVSLVSRPTSRVIREDEDADSSGRTRRRMYASEVSRLKAERRFVQYNPQPGKQNAEREKALKDLRLLIDQYGEEGAWLWDPYLSARDILGTLFYCKYPDVELRALTAALGTPGQPSSGSGASFIELATHGI